MSQRVIRLHLFCSVKGGVGKSTLAIAAAKLLAHLGRKPAFLDCDLSGTSIADGLDLCGPDMTLVEGRAFVDLLAEPTGRYLSEEDTREKRRERKVRKAEDGYEKDYPYPPGYLNDALRYADAVRRRTDDWPKAPRTDALIWRHKNDDGVLYFPSSSVLEDVQGSMGWFLENPYDFEYALMVTIDALIEHRTEITDIVLDLPPGLYGFPHEVLMLATNLQLREQFVEGFPQWVDGPVDWQLNPFMVTSQDPNDFIPALEYVMRCHEELPSMIAIVNKRKESLNAIKALARARLGSLWADSGIEETKLKDVGHHNALEDIFRKGNIAMKDIPEELYDVLRLREK